jgi:hypothetical protein
MLGACFQENRLKNQIAFCGGRLGFCQWAEDFLSPMDFPDRAMGGLVTDVDLIALSMAPS